ncbi:MAG: DUF2062 domain-containing protein [Bacteroidetes bacterium HGW-Bacteroidetes-3]|jgi:uncharacterized protein (DUF2062 family)|nr:MAG: DUF2062 domain-containing protein [Bacteroidetes bacterium HGW-Bacteroidetes-3]
MLLLILKAGFKMNLNALKKHKYILKIKKIFTQGISLKEIILSAALGSLIGIMPILGVATILITFLTLRFKLNIAVAIAFTYVVAPLQAILFIPFIHLGEKAIGIKHTLLTFEAIKNAFNSNVLITMKDLWLEIVCGLMGWSAIAIPIFIFIITFKPKNIKI